LPRRRSATTLLPSFGSPGLLVNGAGMVATPAVTTTLKEASGSTAWLAAGAAHAAAKPTTQLNVLIDTCFPTPPINRAGADSRAAILAHRRDRPKTRT